MIIVDLGFGDSGKGTIVDFWAHRGFHWIVRFNGGPQAAHNVVTPDGRHHTFAQFGSGSFHPNVQTLLSRFMLIEPFAMFNEADHLRQIGVAEMLPRTFIDERCLVIMPPQQIANRLRERARGAGAHGTCGIGVGQCMEDSLKFPEMALRAGDLKNADVVHNKLRACAREKAFSLRTLLPQATLQEHAVFTDLSWIDHTTQIYQRLAKQAQIIPATRAIELLEGFPLFEGAQGVLLDERFGFNPHTTWSKTTFDNANLLLDEAGYRKEWRKRVGVIRPYLTRHGAGPLVTEDDRLTAIPEPHNCDDGWSGKFRRGILDLVMLRYALKVCGGVDELAITCLDHLPLLPPIACERYEVDGPNPIRDARPVYRPWPTHDEWAFSDELQRALGVPVTLWSNGPTRDHKREVLAYQGSKTHRSSAKT